MFNQEKREQRRTNLLKAFEAAQAEGIVWCYMADLTKRAAEFDEAYLQHRQRTNKWLGYIGIHRSDMPPSFTYLRSSTLYPLLAVLERQGIIEGQFFDHNDLAPDLRMYRLTGEVDSASRSL